MSQNKKPKKPKKPGRRHGARQAAVQALYQWHFNPVDRDILEESVLQSFEEPIDKAYFSALIAGSIACVDQLDKHIEPNIDRQLSELDPVELAVLRLATYELEQCPDVPAVVVINEGVELAKTFGADQSYKYINGVLDKVARTLRPNEC